MDTSLRHRVNAGREILRQQVSLFGQQFGEVGSQWKMDDTRVTFVDFAVSERVFSGLRRFFPDDHFCSEESNPQDEEVVFQSRYAWILDPIDGTNNYALGIPFCCISLALLRDGWPVYGFVYDFSRDVLLHGGPGVGMFRDGRALRCSPGRFHPRESVIGMHFPLSPELFGRLSGTLTTYRIRCLGSAALMLAYVAEGSICGCLLSRVKVWDFAAAYAFLRTRESSVRFLSGNPFPMDRFHVDMPQFPLLAGHPEFCKMMTGLLDDHFMENP